MKETVKKALYRKAVGYTVKESVEEYGAEDDAPIKRKISKKHVPPDLGALKALMELEQGENVARLSDEQLEEAKIRLLEELRASNMRKENHENHQKR